MALSQADAARTPAEADVVFALFQLAGRTGVSFDADALTALGQTPDELQRRTVHEALRLKARRDRLEREGVQKTAAAMRRAATTGLIEHDIADRGRLRDYDERLAAAEAQLTHDGVSLRGARIVPLARLKAVLAPNEAALAVAPTFGGLAYMCVRRDSTMQTVGAVDFKQMTLDAKLLQAALAATHAPSEQLDSQFPAAAAVRLYGVLLKPFEPCLRTGDRLVWLGGVASVGVPLSALLPAAPPKLEHGYDLAAADWVVRHHAVSYAGSASALVALRARPASAGTDFDFLGVGDPQLAQGTAASAPVTGLAPLPETAAELQASARGFAKSRILLGRAATEGGFRSELVGEYRYLSFATHGLLRNDLQGLADPALVFTPTSSGDAGDDGLLAATEIADLNLRASFVALSACNTANFDFDQMAQDLPALASAFAVSGVPATLGTLWPVNSRTGEIVVSRVFAGLQANAGPAEALAEAQRAFLAAPPSRAYLHPRFWAPFVILGDGRVQPSPIHGRETATLAAVETLTPAGGEVLALVSAPQGVAARFIVDPDQDGRHGQGVRLAASGGEAWRRVDQTGHASRVLAQLGPVLVAGSYGQAPTGRTAPQLAAYDREGGLSAAWRGEALSRLDAGFLAAAPLDGSEMVAVVGDRARPGDAERVRLRVLRVGQDLAPRVLFEIEPPKGLRISNATITPLGAQLLITFTADNLPAAQPDPNLEDYDARVCFDRRKTWVELRDAATGQVMKSGVLDDFVAVAATAASDGAIFVAGSRSGGCQGERQASVVALDHALKARTLYVDATLGASEVRALAPLPHGEVFVAAYKESLFDYAAGGPPQAYGPRIQGGRSFSAYVFNLDAAGRASATKPLDSGFDTLPTTALAAADGEVLLGGSLAGHAAIFHFAVRP
jgi:CHAT domain-containing protein